MGLLQREAETAIPLFIQDVMCDVSDVQKLVPSVILWMKGQQTQQIL